MIGTHDRRRVFASLSAMALAVAATFAGARPALAQSVSFTGAIGTVSTAPGALSTIQLTGTGLNSVTTSGLNACLVNGGVVLLINSYSAQGDTAATLVIKATATQSMALCPIYVGPGPHSAMPRPAAPGKSLPIAVPSAQAAMPRLVAPGKALPMAVPGRPSAPGSGPGDVSITFTAGGLAQPTAGIIVQTVD